MALYRYDGFRFTIRWFAVFSTATDCSGAFDWSGSRASWRIPITASAQTVTGLLFATISDCAVFHSPLTLADGSALPSYVTYDRYTHVMTVNVGASQAPATITVKACANLNDRVTTAKLECQTKTVELIYVATSISWSPSTLSMEKEKNTSSQTYPLTTVSATPANAFIIAAYSLVGAPSFFALTTSPGVTTGSVSSP